MTLSVSFKHHWVYFLLRRSEDRVTDRPCVRMHLCKHVEARGVEALTGAGIGTSELNGFSRWGLLSYSDCCAHMDSGLVRPSILVAAVRPPCWTCAVPCVYTRSLASVGNVYPAEVQQCCALSQLYGLSVWLERKSHRTHLLTNIRSNIRLTGFIPTLNVLMWTFRPIFFIQF